MLKRVDFDATVGSSGTNAYYWKQNGTSNHKDKEIIGTNQFLLLYLYYMKGKDMILSDFLSQQKNDDSDPNEIIPISFDMYQILKINSI